MKTTINDFQFAPRGYGHYDVWYTSPTTGRKWHTVTNDMQLIDDTKNADNPKRNDLNELKYFCKNH